jgi:hypothetical protein
MCHAPASTGASIFDLVRLDDHLKNRSPSDTRCLPPMTVGSELKASAEPAPMTVGLDSNDQRWEWRAGRNINFVFHINFYILTSKKEYGCNQYFAGFKFIRYRVS